MSQNEAQPGTCLGHKNSHQRREHGGKSVVDEDRQEYALRHLIALSFLGVEVRPNEFRYCSNIDEIQKLERLSERFADDSAIAPRYQIHKAFHAFLEVASGD